MRTKLKKNFNIAMLFLNVVDLIFMIVCASVDKGVVALNALTAITLAIISADFFCGALSNSKWGVVHIGVLSVLYLLNYACALLAGLSIFPLSANIVGTIAFCLIPITSGVLIFFDLKRGGELQVFGGKFYVLFKKIAAFAAVIGVVVLFAVGLVILLGNRPNMNADGFLFITIAVALAALLLRISRENGYAVFKNKNVLPYAVAVFALCAVVAAEFTATESKIWGDIKNANVSFEAAFGKVDAAELRDAPYSLAEKFYGVSTADYKLERNQVYFVSERESDVGLTLAYDVYYPTYEGAHKSVLLNLHGSGGEKDIGNYAHRNKYFASRGYVVYDIQYGDFNERGTDFKNEFWEGINKSEYLMSNIDEFFRYVTAHNTIGADFSSTFISGVSMGGSITLKYGLSYDNVLDEVGVTLKGILPIYPGYWPADVGTDNYINYIDADSVPCLLTAGSGDYVVDPDSVWYIGDAYKNAGNDKYAAVSISYAGHGFDYAMTGRGNQVATYFMERFMYVLR